MTKKPIYLLNTKYLFSVTIKKELAYLILLDNIEIDYVTHHK